jgi:hypothetical protein
MNEEHDPLVAELAALRPQPISPGLKERLAERLSGAGPMPASRQWAKKRTTGRLVLARLALASGLIATSVAAMLLLWPRSRPVREPGPSAILSPLPLAPAFDDSLPSVWMYRRALGHSLHEFDALLDQHAILASQANLDSLQFHSFTRFDSRMYSQPGEL